MRVTQQQQTHHVADGISQQIGETEGKEWNRRERDGAPRIQRKRADNMRREQQAQPHSSHTTRRHPRKEGTQRQQPPTMQEETAPTTISSQLIPAANGKWPKARGHHTTHTEQANPHPSMTRHHNFLPSHPQWDTEPNSTQSHAVHHTRRKRESGCALPLSSPSPHDHGKTNRRHTQLPACTTKGASKSTACGCVCLHIRRNKKMEQMKEWDVNKHVNAQQWRRGNGERRKLAMLVTAPQPQQRKAASYLPNNNKA
ncbi:hypothetical protein MOQ_006595 [Trypanosoma cruzi marinkellei]|uniref:Uncharacterized protein n=1 Tax=Trypanosoma cruzi marinkellei TaxID=85056 RepID=K2NL69_TRYCR|nr:hypothetical protein MOQ_006595 [Trypanosoma cruzi marinkellei]